MDISDDEREFLRGMRALTIGDDGHEVFVGLNAEESEEFWALTRRNESGEDMNAVPRFKELRDRHEAARLEIVEGRASLD